MLQKCRKLLRNEKGLTLIELLAVVVILGIIAAIAIPSIGGLIDNSKKDAHVANAQQMANSAKLAVTSDASLTQGKVYLPLQYLEDNKLIETMKDPDGDLTSYTRGDATTSTGDSAPATGSYVYVNNGTVEAVKLVSNKKNRGVQSTTNGAVDVEDLKREEVRNTTAESE